MKNKHVSYLLLERLERIHADSIWAHQASGVRGALMKMIQRMEAGHQTDQSAMMSLVSYGFQILEKAAREKTSLSSSSQKENSSGK